MALTPEQINTIKATVPVLQQYGDTITALFYKNMLAAHPELNAIFSTSNQATGRQPRALAGALLAYASNIDNLSALSPSVELMCNKHTSLYVRSEHYQIVGKHLLEAMGLVLGDALTPEIHAAWAAAYWQLANVLIEREKELYASARQWTDWREFRIVRKVQESTEITSFHLEPVDGVPLPSFHPGQYVSIQIDIPALGYPQPRQYSLSERPRPDYYRISPKKELGNSGPPGAVSNRLHNTHEPGDVLRVSHPFGDFFLSDLETQADHPVVLIGAGVGLTPLISMVNMLSQPESGSAVTAGRKIHFIHGARSAAARAFTSHLRALEDSTPGLHVSLFTSHPGPEEKEGVDYRFPSRVALDKLDTRADLFLNDARTIYYVCGPTKFMEDIAKGLKSLGVEGERVKMELFGTGGT